MYWNELDNVRGECLNEWHTKNYGEGFKYQDFGPMFKADLFDPYHWAEIFSNSRARYVVLTSKHMDGMALWPSPQKWGWNTYDVGPHRDIVGELASAIRERTNITFGLYHSLLEWFNPRYLNDIESGTLDYPEIDLIPMLQDMVVRYKPEIIWSDGDWVQPAAYWQSAKFLAWLYNESPVKDTVVVNPRWGPGSSCPNSCFVTVELSDGGFNSKVWEEAKTIGSSWGYHRGLYAEDYHSSDQLIHWLIRVVAFNGNLLLNIGPEGDGRIPLLFQERLRDIGAWLDVNGQAIFDTTWYPLGQTEANRTIFYTLSENEPVVYAIFLTWPRNSILSLTVAKPGPISNAVSVQFVGLESAGNLPWSIVGDSFQVTLPYVIPGDLPCQHAWVLKMYGMRLN